MNVWEECCWWVKAKLTSKEQADEERAALLFERSTRPELVKGAVFEWDRRASQSNSGSTASTAASNVLSTALSSLSKIAGASVIVDFSPVTVLVRLSIPDKTGKDGGAPEPAVLTKITDMIMQNTDKLTCLEWTSLELKENKPKHSGRLPLHLVQTVKEKNGSIVLSDHSNVTLFEAKAENAAIAKKWVGMLQEAIKVLAPQIEDEAAASRGVTYRAKQLEKLEDRKREREEEKKKLGNVGMAFTAKAMMKD